MLYKSFRVIGEVRVGTEFIQVETNFFPKIREPAEPNFSKVCFSLLRSSPGTPVDQLIEGTVALV